MIIIIIIIIIIIARAYHRPTLLVAPSWPDSSTGGALHWHCRGQGSGPIQAFLSLLLK